MLQDKIRLLTDLISQNSKTIKSMILLFIVFVFFKSLVYFAPLFINELVDSIEEFGRFEYSLNFGQTFAGVFSMGFASAYAFFVLTKKKDFVKPVFHLHFSILTVVLALVSLIIPTLLSNVYFGACILGVAFANQLFLVSVLKLRGRNKTAVVLDSVVYITMFIIAITIYLNVFSFSLELWFGSILFILVLTTLLFHLKNINGIKKIKKTVFKEVYYYGFWIIIASPLLFLITSNTRLYIGYFSTYEDVGLYSLYIRTSSVVFILSRVFGIMLFRKMFVENHRVLDKYYAIISLVYLFFNALVFFVLPYILIGRNSDFTITFNENNDLFIICLFQITFWIHTSFFEPIIQRENKMKQFIIVLIIDLFLMIVTLFVWNHFSSLRLIDIVIINTLFIFILFFGQQLILLRLNIFYKKTMLIHIGIGILFIVSIFLI